MRGSGRIRLTTALALAATAIITPVVGTGGAASAAPPRDNDALVRQLVDASRGSARIDKYNGTDKVRFVGTPAGKAIRRPSGVAADAAPETAARAFFNSYGRLFGVRDAARELSVTKTRTGTGGVRTVRLQQSHDGIPVVGGDLVVQLERDNDIVSAYGETTSRPATTTPRVGAEAARAIALAVIAKGRGVGESALRASAPSLAVYDSTLLGGPGLGVPTLVWRTEVTAATGQEMRELVLVDAARGIVALHFDQLAHAKDREVCDNHNARTPTDACSSPVFTEVSGPLPGDTSDAAKAYDFAGDTYDFFFDRFGRDSLDNAGMKLTSVVRFCPPEIPGAPAEFQPPCPFPNAYWNGTHMVYGAGFASADDVVGHELTHGVTDNESQLFYFYQSGAINESLSDIFGEFIDQTNGAGNDSASAKWLLGEDIGAIRNMKNPPAFGDPDSMTSTLYSDLPVTHDFWDNGGVHANSGVGNKAAFLMTDGGTFGGKTVTGLGIQKAARIWYDAALALTSASEYRTLYNVLQQACANAVGGAEAVTVEDCVEVKDAVDAVKMSLQPTLRGRTGVFAPTCPGSTLQTPVKFEDDLENPGLGNWSTSSIWDPEADGSYVTNPSENGLWYYPQSTQPWAPYGWDPTYATSGATNMWVDAAWEKVDSSITRTSGVAVTEGTFLQFNHAHLFEFDPAAKLFFDAGVVEYSADEGPYTTVPSTWFTDNGYNGTVYNGGTVTSRGRLAGKRAFVGNSKGYTSSRIYLGVLKDKSVRLRFRYATDHGGGFYGWFIDDVSVYDCNAYATTLSIARSASKIVARSSVRVSGTLTQRGTGVGIGGKTIQVYGRPLSPASPWKLLKNVTTTSTGGYSADFAPKVNFEFTTRFRGIGNYLAAPANAAPNVYVAPKVSASFSDSTISRYASSYLAGAVYPSHAGRRVYLQRYSGGRWRTVTYKALSSTSRYRFKVKPGVRGTFKYRVYIKAHSDHIAGKSPTRSLKVS